MQERETNERNRRADEINELQRQVDEQVVIAVALQDEENQGRRRGSQLGRRWNVQRHRVRIFWKIILSQLLCTLMLIFEGDLECNLICSIKSCMIFAIMMHTLFKSVMLLGFWGFFRSKSLQLLYECWRMEHLLIRWMRLPGWGSPLRCRLW